MERNSTNFFNEVKQLLEQYIFTNDGEYSELFYYQQWFRVCFEKNYSKGLIANHHMGSGKTILAAAIIDTALNMGYTKVFFIAPASLEGNIYKGLDEYEKLTGRTIDKSIFNFIRKSYTVVKNISKKETDQEFTVDTNAISRNIKTIDKALVIIEEAHMVMQSISNGSPGMIQLYDLIMNSPNTRVLMMTGTLVNTHPFELVPMFNLAAGEHIFPETRKGFMEAFWDRDKKEMINKNKFQNRIAGLISRIDPRALQLTLKDGKITNRESSGESKFPQQFETQIMKVPMSGRQAGLYMVRREKELKENFNKKINESRAVAQKFGRQDKQSSTYRVRTRQCSNYAPPPEIESLYAREGGYSQEDINRVMDAATPEELESTKFIAIDQIARKHKNQKGIVYSQFTDIGGNGAFARYLQTPERKISASIDANEKSASQMMKEYLCCGYQLLEFDKKGSPVNLGPKTFAMLNGSIEEPRYGNILKIFNDSSNDHGEKLPLLLIGLREALGLDLKCVRYVVMMEPYFIYSLLQQLFARANRYASHMRLDPIERNVQPYVMIATYPLNFDTSKYINSQLETKVGLSALQLEQGLDVTTDEYIYNLMLANRDKIDPFEHAAWEVSIECNVLKQYFPDMQCKMCAPDNRKLYTDLLKGHPPDKLFYYDLGEADPCQDFKTEEIDAVKVTIKSPDGSDIDYYYTNNPSSPTGVSIYYHDTIKDIFEEIFPSSPAYAAVIGAIKK